MTDYRVLCLPGDGIGPEIMTEARKVLDAVGERFGHQFHLTEGLVGLAAIEAYGVAIRREELDAGHASDSILFGAVGGAGQDTSGKTRPEQAIFGLRKEYNLFANLRPVKVQPALAQSSPVKPEVLEGVDMIIVRELTGGLYFGSPKERRMFHDGTRMAIDTMTYTDTEIERIVRVACDLAVTRRGKVTNVDKANVLMTSRLWREVAHEVADSYGGKIEMDDLLVDAATISLIREPRRFDVLVMENTFGDILSDEVAVLAGSLGVLPSASLNGQPPTRPGSPAQRFGLYEPIHGTAPDIAGRGIANPLGMILSATMMLRTSFGLAEEADAVEAVISDMLTSGESTPDLGGSLKTTDVGDRVAARVRNWGSEPGYGRFSDSPVLQTT